jgi:hypothetical protein
LGVAGTFRRGGSGVLAGTTGAAISGAGDRLAAGGRAAGRSLVRTTGAAAGLRASARAGRGLGRGVVGSTTGREAGVALAVAPARGSVTPSTTRAGLALDAPSPGQPSSATTALTVSSAKAAAATSETLAPIEAKRARVLRMRDTSANLSIT